MQFNHSAPVATERDGTVVRAGTEVVVVPQDDDGI